MKYLLRILKISSLILQKKKQTATYFKIRLTQQIDNLSSVFLKLLARKRHLILSCRNLVTLTNLILRI